MHVSSNHLDINTKNMTPLGGGGGVIAPALGDQAPVDTIVTGAVNHA